MQFTEYQEQAMQFAQYEDENYPFVAITEELGEFLSLYAKALRGDDLLQRFASYEELENHIKKEAGDVLWQLTACLMELDIPLEDVAKMNIEKLTDRAERGVIKGSGDAR